MVKANVQAQPDRASAHGVERGCFSLRRWRFVCSAIAERHRHRKGAF